MDARAKEGAQKGVTLLYNIRKTGPVAIPRSSLMRWLSLLWKTQLEKDLFSLLRQQRGRSRASTAKSSGIRSPSVSEF